jgi:hypothetical protein
MYIKTCNLTVSLTIHIQNPCLHGGVDSESCRIRKREKKKTFGVCVTHILSYHL